MNFFDLFDCCTWGGRGEVVEVGGEWEVLSRQGKFLGFFACARLNGVCWPFYFWLPQHCTQCCHSISLIRHQATNCVCVFVCLFLFRFISLFCECCAPASPLPRARSVGLLRLQQIYQELRPGNETFRVQMVKRIANVTMAIEFLHTMEDLGRFSKKRIVLDCPAEMAKEIIVQHVRDVKLGRRTYHYLLSGLVSIPAPTLDCPPPLLCVGRAWQRRVRL